jgi:hypothetical protein
MSLSLNLESIILLLIFIAPGFLFTRTYTAYRPRYYRSPAAFEQFVLAIVGSTIIHAGLLTVMALGVLIYWLLTGQQLYITTLINPLDPLNSYSILTLANFTFAGIVYLVSSLIFARRFATFLGHGTAASRPRWWTLTLGQDPPEPFLLWHTILQIEPLNLDLIPPHVRIQMRNGEYFEGDLYRFRLVGDEENTVELALRNVLHRSSPPSSGQADLSSQGSYPLPDQTVLLKSTDILWLARDDAPQQAGGFQT